MRYGVILPGGDATQQFELALLAEATGWDGVFVWESGYGVDAWTLLGAIATATRRVRLGTVLTPLPWRRPWKVASQVVTLDRLSAGRAILGVGLGAVTTDLPLTGEVLDVRIRAEMMDEGIDLIRALWGGATHFTAGITSSTASATISPGWRNRCRRAFRSGWSAPGTGPSRCGACCAATA
jgi:alkanesulfonate monooxygenase SsuD/methylene tetrahydromethanopterin reductase-like flavin-dependent oxidoreductase (luciferase family)